jgi:hypothetical protein
MLLSIRTFVSALVAATLLAGCQSANLIELNNQYIDLIKQQNEIAGLVDNGLGPTDATAIRTGIRDQFANIGDEALKIATDAAAKTRNATTDTDKIKARRNEASFLSLAVRSYLSSGEIADHKVVPPCERGIHACQSLTGLQGLPTTCGYFHIAQFVGIHNEAIRKARPVLSRARALKAGQKLPTVDGRSLEASINAVIAQLSALTDTGGNSEKINWADAGKGLIPTSIN